MTRQAGFTLPISVQPQSTRNVTVSWDASGADNVTLDGISVPATGSKTEVLSDGHTYTLAGDMNAAIATVSGHININISPFPPTNVVASVIDATSANITWDCSSPNLTGFNVDMYNASNDSLLRSNVKAGSPPGGSFSYTETGITTAGSYYWKVSAFDKHATGVAVKSNTIAISGTPTGFRILPSLVANAVAKAVANDSSWTNLRSFCDTNLPLLNKDGTYQGSWLPRATDYAMAARCADAVGDSVRADNYTRKAVGIIKTALRDYCQGGWHSRQFLAVANGTDTRFTLAETPIVGSQCSAYLLATSVSAIVRTSAVSDAVAFSCTFILVSDNADGTSPYTENVDWRHTGNLANNLIEWIVGGRHPSTGATYYVKQASSYAALLRTTTLDRTVTPAAIVFSTPPATNTAIFVEYVRDDYSETGMGAGGYNNMFIDGPGYVARYLGISVVPVLDWCAGHSAVEAIRAEACALLVRWCDYSVTTAYAHGGVQSNYNAAYYLNRAFTGLLLEGTTDGDRVLSDLLSFRTTVALPQWTGTTVSTRAGYWGEGWNYGAMAVYLEGLGTKALVDAGKIDPTLEWTWFNQICEHIAHATLTPSTILPFGDNYAWPAPRPSQDYLAFYSYLASDPAKGGLLSDGLPSSGWQSVAISSLPAKVQPSTLGLSQWNSGTGCMLARTGWDANRVFAAWIAGNLLGCDHQEEWACGSFGLWRGNDALLVAERWVSMVKSPSLNSQHSNVLVADDGGTGLQSYRFNQGVFYLYGGPGIILLAQEETADYIRTAQDCTASYTKQGATVPGGSLTQWVRHWLFLKATGTLLVCDFYSLKTASCVAWVRINLAPGADPTIAGDTFTIDRGASRLVGQVLSSDAVTYYTTLPTGWVLPLIDAKTGLLSGKLTSVFQVGASGATLTPAILNPDGSIGVNGRTISFNINGSISFA